MLSSEFSKFFNFSAKSDPFLVQPSLKHAANSVSGSVAVGGGAHALKSLRRNPQQRQVMMVVPLHNTLLKLLKQSEVYLMEEAVTD